MPQIDAGHGIAVPGKPPVANLSAAEGLAATVREFLETHPAAAVLEGGKVVFELDKTRWLVSTSHDRCTLQLWSSERHLVRTVVKAAARPHSLRVGTHRFGQRGEGLLQIEAKAPPRTAKTREPARQAFQHRLERVLRREFPDWQPAGFRTSMDLQRSFGPAYARGMLVRGREAWAVIGAGACETQAVVDGILTFGILWLHHCREQAAGRRSIAGLRIVVPSGGGALTLARLPWLNGSAAQWQLFELEESSEALVECDPADQGNLRTRLVHLPDARAARERFAAAIDQVMALVPPGEGYRVEQRLQSPAELVFALHGLPFARAFLAHLPGSFRQVLEIRCGQGAAQVLLGPDTAAMIRTHFAELFRRRDARSTALLRPLRPQPATRSIGLFTGRAAHGRLSFENAIADSRNDPGASGRLEQRQRHMQAQSDPLFRASPERWLESVLRENLAPLTRSLAVNVPPPSISGVPATVQEQNLENWGNQEQAEDPSQASMGSRDRVIPRFNPGHVYSQVPAIAGASDRGMLDLLGVTADGRLAVLEIKASDDIHLPLQGLDYWLRVLHHHRQTDLATGSNEWQQHGYFRDVVLSPLPPRLYLVAPALQVHPAIETVLRYLSPRVEWMLVALDERWRSEVHVVWRKSGGGPSATGPDERSRPVAERG